MVRTPRPGSLPATPTASTLNWRAGRPPSSPGFTVTTMGAPFDVRNCSDPHEYDAAALLASAVAGRDLPLGIGLRS
ncbi:hypothetical protein WKI68_09570 [Streptomyces sp. MS1.HAVA.3]|uniref:Uncharacterized protein n=1 Tax=Streptomyces caledonius TaxID=3134107 RepID=A0ABU8U1A0_9ACTN